MARQSRRLQPNGQETTVNRPNIAAHGYRKARDIGDKVGEAMADKGEDDTGEMEVAENDRDVPMTETAGETETGAAASNDLRNSAQLNQVKMRGQYLHRRQGQNAGRMYCACKSRHEKQKNSESGTQCMK